MNRIRALAASVAIAGAALCVAFALPATSAPLGAVGGRITVFEDGAPRASASNVVVYLEGAAVQPRPLQRNPQVHQRDVQFAPELTVVPKGTTIDFPNDDSIFHNVFSVSEAAPFDLGLYKSGESKSVQFARPGVVDVYCNIHPQMVAKIKVLDTPYYALPANSGAFYIPNVPPGSYAVVAWQPYGDEFHGSVRVSPGGITSLSIRLTAGPKPRSHLRKNGQPYGRYK